MSRAKAEATKSLIKESCKELFLRKGYASATGGDIKRATGLAMSVVSYHFGSKDKLAVAIALDCDMQSMDRAEAALGNTHSRLLLEVAHAYLFWSHLSENDPLRRFLTEVSGFRLSDASTHEYMRERYRRALDELPMACKTDKDVALAAASQLAANNALMWDLGNQEDCDWRYAAEFSGRLFLQNIGVVPDRIEDLIREGRLLAGA